MRPEDFAHGLERKLPDRALLQQHEDEFARDKAESYDEAVAEVQASRQHHDDILAAVRAIVEHHPLELDQLLLSEQERSALEALRTAFEGKDARYNSFVYAELRRELLEHALAALQAALALDISRSAELHENYERIVSEVADLRERLANLEDAQDDERLHVAEEHKVEPKDDDDGANDGADDGADDGDQAAPKPSQIWDDPAKVPPEPASAQAPSPSQIWDDPAKVPPEPVSVQAPSPSQVWDGPSQEGAPTSETDERRGLLSRLGRAIGLGGKPSGQE